MECAKIGTVSQWKAMSKVICQKGFVIYLSFLQPGPMTNGRKTFSSVLMWFFSQSCLNKTQEKSYSHLHVLLHSHSVFLHSFIHSFIHPFIHLSHGHAQTILPSYSACKVNINSYDNYSRHLGAIQELLIFSEGILFNSQIGRRQSSPVTHLRIHPPRKKQIAPW